jgi:hypothetical protein
MKTLKRLLLVLMVLSTIPSVLLMGVIFLITWIPFGSKPTDWWVDNTLANEKLNDYFEKLQDEI